MQIHTYIHTYTHLNQNGSNYIQKCHTKNESIKTKLPNILILQNRTFSFFNNITTWFTQFAQNYEIVVSAQQRNSRSIITRTQNTKSSRNFKNTKRATVFNNKSIKNKSKYVNCFELLYFT